MLSWPHFYPLLCQKIEAIYQSLSSWSDKWKWDSWMLLWITEQDPIRQQSAAEQSVIIITNLQQKTQGCCPTVQSAFSDWYNCTSPPPRLQQRALMNTTYRDLLRPLTGNQQQGSPPPPPPIWSWRFGMPVMAVRGCIMFGLNKSQPRSWLYLWNWTQITSPYAALI